MHWQDEVLEGSWLWLKLRHTVTMHLKITGNTAREGPPMFEVHWTTFCGLERREGPQPRVTKAAVTCLYCIAAGFAGDYRG